MLHDRGVLDVPTLCPIAVSDEGDLVTAHLVIPVRADNRRVYRYPFFKEITLLNLTTALTVLSFLTKC